MTISVEDKEESDIQEIIYYDPNERLFTLFEYFITFKASIKVYHTNIVYFPFVFLADIITCVIAWGIIFPIIILFALYELVLLTIILMFLIILVDIYYLVVLAVLLGYLIINVFCCCLPIILSFYKIIKNSEDYDNIKKNICTILVLPFYLFLGFAIDFLKIIAKRYNDGKYEHKDKHKGDIENINDSEYVDIYVTCRAISYALLILIFVGLNVIIFLALSLYLLHNS